MAELNRGRLPDGSFWESADLMLRQHALFNLNYRHWLLFACVQVPLVAFMWSMGYANLFSLLARHDDQGFVMMIVKSLLEHQRIYDDVPNPYGPFYLGFQQMIHGVLSVPLTDDSVRVQTLVTWIAASTIAGSMAVYVSRSALLGAAAQLASYFSLCGILSEPGHPQELLAVLLLLFCFLSVWQPKNSWWKHAALGATAAAILLTKINLGIFATGALGLWLVAGLPCGRIRDLLLGASLVVLAIIPWALTHQVWPNAAALGYSALITLAFVPMGFAIWRHRSAGLPTAARATVGATAGAFVLIFILGLTLVVVQGSSLKAIFESLVIFPTRLIHVFYVPAPVTILSVALATLSAAVGMWAFWTKRTTRVKRGLILAGKGIFAAYVMSSMALFYEEFYGQGRLVFALAWSWLAVFRPSADESSTPLDTKRCLACVTAIFIGMWAFPVWGTQLSLSSFLLIVPATFCAADILSELTPALWPPRAPRIVVAAAAIGAMVGTGWVGHKLWGYREQALRRYESNIPLGFPGCTVRVGRNSHSMLTELVGVLRGVPNTFFVVGGHYIFHFWTGKTPPSTILVGHTVKMLSRAQQDRLLDELLASPDLIVVIPPNTEDLQGEFCDRLLRHFVRWKQVGGYTLLRRVAASPVPE